MLWISYLKSDTHLILDLFLEGGLDVSNGYWVALANGEYVSWTGSIPQC